MSVPLYVPFNFMPNQVISGLGSYSVPAGYYARATFSLRGAKIGTINGNTCIESSQWTALSSDNIRLANGSGSTLNGAMATSTDTTPANFNAAGSAFNETTAETVISQSFWVPTGTTLNTSGAGNGYITVELYLIPS